MNKKINLVITIYARFDEGKCTVQSEFDGSPGVGPLSVGGEVTAT